MVVWMMEEKLKCPDCGTREDEWDPRKGGVFHAYHISRFTCLNCKNIEDTYEDVRKESGKKKVPNGFKVRLIPDYIWKQRTKIRKQLQFQQAKDKRDALAEKARQRHFSIASDNSWEEDT